MLTEIILDFKNRWFSGATFNEEIEEFERIESQHTRVIHDEDVNEIIRVH